MQYLVRNRRRLRPTTGEQARVVASRVPTRETPPAARLAEGSGLHQRPLVITEINATRPIPGRGR